METQTDREIMIKLDGKIDHLAASLERVANSLERLEMVKFDGHEKRIARLEKFQNQWAGALIAFNIAAIIIGILISIFG